MAEAADRRQERRRDARQRETDKERREWRVEASSS